MKLDGLYMKEKYVYKKEVDWSLLMEGLALPLENQVVFGKIMGRFLQRGERKEISVYLDGKTYRAAILNLNIDKKWNTKDKYQIRYLRNGDLARALQKAFHSSFQYLQHMRELREPNDRRILRLPEDAKEYLAIYTTEYDDSYIFEPIISKDISVANKYFYRMNEQAFEGQSSLDLTDSSAGLEEKMRIAKVRKLDRSIGDNLKLLYGYRCQICGKFVGEEFSAHVVEAHHIDYFVKSLNNDASNQLIICPNHHRIIHEVNPVFDRKSKEYIYENGKIQGLVLNCHL